MSPLHQTSAPASPLAEELRHQISGSHLRQLSIVRDDYDEGSFGDALIVFRADEVLLRFVRDRGLVTVDVGAGDRFLSLDFLACRQDWTDWGTIARHYNRPSGDPETGSHLPREDGEDLYREMPGALEASDEAEVERVVAQLEARPEAAALSPFSEAPRGPYFGVALQNSRPRAPADAIRTLSEHWSEVTSAVADEQSLRRACEEELAFWKAIRHTTPSPGIAIPRFLTAT